jgi:NAD(P)-dependent dehydrogenase (short-subunit alcohol dehydrogenase family)
MQTNVVLVTGAKGGLGSFVTRAFLENGSTVAGVSRSISQSDFPDKTFYGLAADINSGDSARKVTDGVMQRYGRIDALVHVMGGFAGGQSIAETDDATWERMRDLNLSSAFFVARAVLPHMRKAGTGSIIAVSSRTALGPHAGIGAYVVFKSALLMLIRTIALENEDVGITANAVLPGTMDTSANRASEPNADFSRWVQPADVANLILWLASEQARKVSGATIAI